MLERLFGLSEHGTTVRTEILAGATTFLTMAYIIFVNPQILATTGMDHGAVFVATCLASAVASAFMGFYANYPIAMAPGMGLNAYFAYTVVGQMGYSWQVALGAVFLSGVLFLVISILPIREAIVNSSPAVAEDGRSRPASASSVGIIALQNAGVIIANPATMVGIGNLHAVPTVLAAAGFIMATAFPAHAQQKPQEPSKEHVQALIAQAMQQTGQAPAAPVATPIVQSGPTVNLTEAEAVGRATDKNLTLISERITPQTFDFALAATRAAYLPNLTSTLGNTSQTNLNSNAFSGGTQTKDQTQTWSAGMSKRMWWGGGNYSVSFGNNRNTTTSSGSNCSPCFNTNVDAAFTQPLWRNFSIDSTRASSGKWRSMAARLKLPAGSEMKSWSRKSAGVSMALAASGCARGTMAAPWVVSMRS